ncbi:platelet-activating factor acetylhydrolase, partial [Asbolus verrucosus]
MDVMLNYDKEGIFMRLYYPTNAKKNDPDNSSRWCSWMPDNSYLEGIAKVLMIFSFLVRIARWWSVGIIPVLYGNKPNVEQKLKCIILSHGLGGHRSLYSNLCCELASRGYLVTALEHRDRSACYTFYYKSKDDAENKIRTNVEYQPFQLGENHFKQRKEQVEYRAKECSRTVDFLMDLNNGNVPHNVINDVPTHRQIDFRLTDLVGKLDLENLTMAGHSFGGATALLTLAQRHELKHTTHENQTDSVLLIGYWLNWFIKKLDPLVALKINSSIILEFLNRYVGSPSSIEDCKQFLEEQRSNIETGLTKPWA